MEDVERNKQLAIETETALAFEELEIDIEDRVAIEALLEPLKQKDPASYEHCERVGVLVRRIAQFLKIDEKALFFAGILHDIGKSEIPIEVLRKINVWSDEDYELMEQHVIRGYERIKTKFDFTAEVVLLHHWFQKNRYPKELPLHLHNYSEKTRILIVQYVRILALADVFDALHRKNSKYKEEGSLSEIEIKEKMFELNPDKRELIEELYQEGILCAVP